MILALFYQGGPSNLQLIDRVGVGGEGGTFCIACLTIIPYLHTSEVTQMMTNLDRAKEMVARRMD